METVFKTPELVGLVMEHLMMKTHHRNGLEHEDTVLDYFENKKRRRDLAACSRVNKLVSQEALRVLWRSLDWVAPLIGLLPQDVVSRPKIRPLTPHGCGRLMQFLPLVRCLTVAFLESEFKRLFLSFSELFPGQAIFPNLATLVWLGPFHGDLLQVCLGPQVRNFRIRASDTTKKQKLQMTKILAGIPNLESLHIDDLPRLDGFDMQHVLRSSAGLRVLTLPHVHIDAKDLRVILHLPNLEEVLLDINPLINAGLSVGPDITTAHNPSQFPKLQALTLQGTVINSISFLQYLRNYPRTKLMVNTTDSRHPLPQVFIDLFSCIGTFLPQSLLEIVIRPLQYHRWDVERKKRHKGIPLNHLSSLTKFTELKMLVLRLPYVIDIRDKDVTKFCGDFPNLEHLSLCSDPQMGYRQPKLTPSCLAKFAEYAPQLRTLGLHMTSQWIPHVQSEWSPHSMSRLEVLHVGFSELDLGEDRTYEEGDVASSLCDLFPHLQWIRWTYPYIEGDIGDTESESETDEDLEKGRGWNRVQASLPSLHAARRSALEEAELTDN